LKKVVAIHHRFFNSLDPLLLWGAISIASFFAVSPVTESLIISDGENIGVLSIMGESWEVRDIKEPLRL
jgi:hypothetical protein